MTLDRVKHVIRKRMDDCDFLIRHTLDHFCQNVGLLSRAINELVEEDEIWIVVIGNTTLLVKKKTRISVKP